MDQVSWKFMQGVEGVVREELHKARFSDGSARVVASLAVHGAIPEVVEGYGPLALRQLSAPSVTDIAARLAQLLPAERSDIEANLWRALKDFTVLKAEDLPADDDVTTQDLLVQHSAMFNEAHHLSRVASVEVMVAGEDARFELVVERKPSANGECDSSLVLRVLRIQACRDGAIVFDAEAVCLTTRHRGSLPVGYEEAAESADVDSDIAVSMVRAMYASGAAVESERGAILLYRCWLSPELRGRGIGRALFVTGLKQVSVMAKKKWTLVVDPADAVAKLVVPMGGAPDHAVRVMALERLRRVSLPAAAAELAREGISLLPVEAEHLSVLQTMYAVESARLGSAPTDVLPSEKMIKAGLQGLAASRNLRPDQAI